MTNPESIFESKSMNEWLEEAKSKPPITPLYDPWWNVGETCFFFGTTGIGKTLFAVQMARSIAEEQKVLFFDFELSDTQQLHRYKKEDSHVVFPDNFIRVEMKKDIFVKPDQIVSEIKKEVMRTDAKIIIIDNITWILDDGQEAKKAIPFMKEIASLKRSLGISVLIIAHTPKRRPMASVNKNQGVTYYDNPLELSDMAGSAALNNFIDSCFAIGKSRMDENLLYLKQLKNRNVEKKHGAENVAKYSLEQDDEGFLSLVSVGVGPEQDHLQTQPRNQIQARKEKAKELHDQSLTSRAIAARLGVSHTTILRDLQE